MTNIKTVEPKEAEVKTIEAPESNEPRLRDALKASRPVKFIARHKVGFGVGLGTATAAIAAGVAAARGVFDGDVVSDITDAASDAIDAATDVVNG